MKYIFILFNLLLFTHGVGANQILMDSLLNELKKTPSVTEVSEIYNLIYKEYGGENPETQKAYLDSNLYYAALSKDVFQEQQAQLNRALYYFRNQNYLECEQIVDDLMDVCEDHVLLIRAMDLKTECLGWRGDFLEALELSLKNLNLKQELDYPLEEIAHSHLDIGHVHGSIDQLETSTQYYKSAMRMFAESNQLKGQYRCLKYIGLNEHILGNTDTAKQYYLDAISAFESLGMPIDVAKIQSNLGSLYVEQGDVVKGEMLYIQALAEFEKEDYLSEQSIIYQRLGEMNIVKGKYEEAKRYLLKSLPIHKSMGHSAGLIRDYSFLSEVSYYMKEYEDAYEWLKSYQQLNDTIYQLEKVEIIAEIEAKYQDEQKTQEILLLEEKNKRGELEKKALIGGLIGLTCFILLAGYSVKQRIDKNKLKSQKIEQDLALSTQMIELKQQELTAYALQVAQKNELLNDFKEQIIAKGDNLDAVSMKRVITDIEIHQTNDDSWEEFRNRFIAVHRDFESTVLKKFPGITNNDLRLMSLIKMNLSSKEIANILNISMDGIKKARYRLRKKLNLDTKDSLENIVLSI